MAEGNTGRITVCYMLFRYAFFMQEEFLLILLVFQEFR